MKKLIALLLAVIMCVGLCACGVSEEVKACQEQIDKIGEVTLESEDAIIAAEKAYEALSEKDKEKLEESVKKLKASREDYENLVAEINEELSAWVWAWHLRNTFVDGGDHVLTTIYILIDGIAVAGRSVAMVELGAKGASLGEAEGKYKIGKDSISITWDEVDNKNGTTGWEVGETEVLRYEMKDGVFTIFAPDGSEMERSFELAS